MSSLPSKNQTLAGWGNCPEAECLTYRPERRQELHQLVASAPSLLARGQGRSYGDAALNPQTTILTVRLDRFLSFDPHEGILKAQAGVTLDEIMHICIPRGFLPAVIPGTRFVSLGGAVAANVHGKNQYCAGEFIEHVLSFTLRLADGNIASCSREQNTELFWATAGGMGLTGIIEDVTVRLRPIGSLSLRAEHWQTKNLQEMVQAFYNHAESADYMVGWLDHFARGGQLGHGIFEHASHIAAEEGGKPLEAHLPATPRMRVPCFMPGFLLNRYSMALYNKLHFRGISTQPQQRVLDFNSFFHPLDGIAHWNRLYGKRGFFQYQCLLPDGSEIAATLQKLLALLQERHAFSFLAVLKYHRASQAPMGFSMPGFSLALDFANTPHTHSALAELDHFVAAEGGRVYLAKDAVLTPSLLPGMYPQIHAWQHTLNQHDPERRFTSLLAQRLHLRGTA